MDRRTFVSLASGTAIGSVAGCIGPEEPALSLGDTVREQVANFTIKEFDIQQSVIYQGAVHPVVRNEKEHQYLIFGVDIVSNSEDVAAEIRGRFTLSLDDDDAIIEGIDNRRISTRNQKDLSSDLYLLYPVSRDIPVGNATLRFSGTNKRYSWSIGDMIDSSELNNYVQNPPRPTVESMEIPDTVSKDSDTVTTTVAVTSDGSTERPVTEPLKMLLSSTKISGSTPFTAHHRKGQTTTHNFAVPIYPNQGPSRETIRLNAGSETISKTVQITA